MESHPVLMYEDFNKSAFNSAINQTKSKYMNECTYHNSEYC